jgi:cholesterol transport system auxiliary component
MCRWGAVALLLLLAAACSAGLHSSAPAAQTYILRAHSAPAARRTARTEGASLRVERPAAAPGLQSARIVLVQSDHRMGYFAGTQWAAELPLLVEELAVERLRASGDWTAVQAADSPFASAWFLQITIRRFEAQYTADAAPTAQVVFDCALGRRADRALLASFSAQGSAVASANRVSAVVAAFDEAVNAALDELAAASAAAVRNSQSPSSP